MEVYFKVTRMTQQGLTSRPLSRLYLLRSWNPEATYDSSLSYYYKYRDLISEFKQDFPELRSDKFKLVAPDVCDEDKIIIQSETDMHIILQLNKKKCTAGEVIDLLVLDPSQKKSTNTIDQGDSKLTDSSQIKKDIDSAILRLIEQMEVKCKEQTARHETITKQLTTLTQENNDQSTIILALLEKMDSKMMTLQGTITDEIKRLLVTDQQIVAEQLATSNQAKTEDSSLLTKLEKMETKMNEQDAKIKRLSQQIFNILGKSEGSHAVPHMVTQLWNEWTEKNWSQRVKILLNEELQKKNLQQNSNQIEIILPITLSDSIIETTIDPEEICPEIEQVLPSSTASDVIENRPFPMDPFGDIISQMSRKDWDGNDDAASVKSVVSSNSSSTGSVWIMEDMVESSSNTDHIITKEEKSIRHPDALIDAALEKMLAMGFKEEGGWLTRLLEVKGGDINQVLSVLHIS